MNTSNYNRANDVCGRVCGNRLLKRLMAPSPKSQVMFASAFSWISDFFRIFGIHSFYATATLLNIWIYMQWTDAADSGCGGGRSKAVANDYRHEYHHRCGLWTLVFITSHRHFAFSLKKFNQLGLWVCKKGTKQNWLSLENVTDSHEMRRYWTSVVFTMMTT